jgi:hypothetical protein
MVFSQKGAKFVSPSSIQWPGDKTASLAEAEAKPAEKRAKTNDNKTAGKSNFFIYDSLLCLINKYITKKRGRGLRFWQAEKGQKKGERGVCRKPANFIN